MSIHRLLFSACLIGCGSSEAPPQPAAPPTAASSPVETTQVANNNAPAQAPSQVALAIGSAPVTLEVPAAPAFTLNVTEPGEYQVDVTSMGQDPAASLYQGDERLDRDDDGGDGNNAQLVKFLAPGQYQVRVDEYHRRAVTVQGQAQRLTPLTPAGSIAPGGSITVETPRGDNKRAAAREVTLTIATAGTYQIDAVSEDKDAQVALIQNNATLIEENSDGGEGRNARIRRQLEPGVYQLRIWDWIRRPASITVTVNPS